MDTCKTKEDCLRVICQLPIIIRDFKNLSAVAIIQKSGYKKFCREIKQQDIVDFLTQEKSLINEWIIWTEDKRGTPAWGFVKEKDEYVVFYLSPASEVEMKQRSSNPFGLCAFMIRMEADGLVKL